jgi:hypothetical protein
MLNKLSRDKLKKITLWGSKMIKISLKWSLKKVDGSVFFWTIFYFIASKSDLLGFIEKQAPPKALCLGPDPPPGEKSKFIEFYLFLTILGPSIEPEKTTPK